MDALTSTRDKVCVVNLNPGVVRHEFVASLLDLVVYDIKTNARIGFVQPMLAGGVMDIYRNMAVERFLQTDAEALLFIDSDMVFPHDILDRLWEHLDATETPVVSGLYCMALDEGVRPSMMYRKKGDDGLIHMTAIEMDDVPENELTPVDGCGAGMLLIHRSLLEAMHAVYGSPQPWFANEPFDGVIYGEDYTFCMRVAQMGFKVYVHTGICAGHVKNYILNYEREVSDAVTT